MKVYDKLPAANLFTKKKNLSVPVLEGWLEKMDNLDSGKWLLCKTWPLSSKTSAYTIATRYRKLYPDYEFANRRISENEVALFGRRKQQMSDIMEMVIPEDFSNHEKMVLWCWKPEAYFGERKALVKLVLEANE